MAIPDKYLFSGTPQQLTEMLPMAELMYQFLQDLSVQTDHPYLAIPSPSVEGLPQVQLWFRETYKNAKADGRPKSQAHSQISFRIKDENDWRQSDAKAERMASRINALFASPIFTINRGEDKLTYWDKKKGYQFTLFVTGRAEAKRVLTQVFNLLEDTPDWNKLTENKSEKDFKTTKTTKVIGETVPVPNQRPITQVHFQYAVAKVPPKMEDIGLIDTVGRLSDAYVRKTNPFFGERSDTGGNHAAVTPLA